MKDKGLILTRSEAIQKVLGKEECTFITSCQMHITRSFFDKICNSKNYVKCHHFAKQVDELRIPMAWLQRKAVEIGEIIEA